MDPADYVLVGDADFHDEEGYEYVDHDLLAERTGSRSAILSDDNEYGRCGHCGQRIRYAAYFLYLPTNEILHVGLTCAIRLSLDNRSTLKRKQDREQHSRIAKVSAWRGRCPENEEAFIFMEEIKNGGRDSLPFGDFWYGRYGIVTNMLSGLNKYGSLSEKQVTFLASIKASLVERREKDAEKAKEPIVPVVEGRIEITGQVVSVKWQDSVYGGNYKMLVLDDRGFKVWGTVPESLQTLVREEVGIEGLVEKGERVQFTATVTKSDRDEDFGFFKRPAKGLLCEG
jgi:hypothetical protein